MNHLATIAARPVFRSEIEMIEQHSVMHEALVRQNSIRKLRGRNADTQAMKLALVSIPIGRCCQIAELPRTTKLLLVR